MPPCGVCPRAEDFDFTRMQMEIDAEITVPADTDDKDAQAKPITSQRRRERIKRIANRAIADADSLSPLGSPTTKVARHELEMKGSIKIATKDTAAIEMKLGGSQEKNPPMRVNSP